MGRHYAHNTPNIMLYASPQFVAQCTHGAAVKTQVSKKVADDDDVVTAYVHICGMCFVRNL